MSAKAPKRAVPTAPVPPSPPPVVEAEEAADFESPDALRKHEGTRKGMLRLARRLAREALAAIERPENRGDRTEDVHVVRVQCKRLRALLRLLKPMTDADVMSAENARLRDAAQGLAVFRDAFVAGETLKRMFEDTAPRRVRDAAMLLGVRPGGLPKQKNDLESALDAVARALRHAISQLRKLPLAAKGWTSLAPGLERSYRRAQKSYLECREHGLGHLGECFHEWRKRVKDLAYQLEFLDNIRPSDVKRLRKEFRRLGTMLGDDHDYVVFAHHVRDRERHYEHLATFHPVRKRLRARLKDLRTREYTVAEPLFIYSPEIWTAHLAGCWQRWKNPASTGVLTLPILAAANAAAPAPKLKAESTAVPPAKKSAQLKAAKKPVRAKK